MSSLEKRKEDMGPGEYEQKAVEAGFVRVCGCDEAGAGPLAGPVYAAAVILAQGADIPGLNDSKKLTEKKTGGALSTHPAECAGLVGSPGGG